MLQHIAIIMDGNGRWAKARSLPRAEGHRRGVEATRAALEGCRRHSVRYLTLYAFSAENWQRPADEVQDLMGLFRRYLDGEVKKLAKENIRIRFIGDRVQLPADIVEKMQKAEAETAGNTGLNLQIALSYGARQELVAAARQLLEGVQAGKWKPEELSMQHISASLTTADIPDPDLLIRTGGEHRISNFLLWQMAYTELYFTDCLWPDFNDVAFDAAVEDFARRERRYGQRVG